MVLLLYAREPQEVINARKVAYRRVGFEQRIRPEATIEDLDLDLAARFLGGTVFRGRSPIKSAGAPNAGGTVQQVNSLRGACITQGVVAAHLLRRAVPGVRITEAHPKALLWLINVASADRRVMGVTMEHLAEFISCELAALCEHERDAALGALGAWAMASVAAGWRDIAVQDPDAVVPVPPVEYWMPIEASPNKALHLTSGAGKIAAARR